MSVLRVYRASSKVCILWSLMAAVAFNASRHKSSITRCSTVTGPVKEQAYMTVCLICLLACAHVHAQPVCIAGNKQQSILHAHIAKAILEMP